MNIYHIGGAVTSSPVSTICFILAFLVFAAIFGVKPFLKKKKIDMAGDLPIAMLVLVFTAVAFAGVQHNLILESKADEKAFTEQLKNDYGVTTDSSFQEVDRAARYDRIVVFKDEKGEFEVRPHLDGSTMTFFRVDNGTQINPKS